LGATISDCKPLPNFIFFSPNLLTNLEVIIVEKTIVQVKLKIIYLRDIYIYIYTYMYKLLNIIYIYNIQLVIKDIGE